MTCREKLADLCEWASSAIILCEPDVHEPSMLTVSLNEPLASAMVKDEPPVSMIGMEVSRLKPMRTRGVKCEPRRVMMPPRSTLDGVTCRDICSFEGRAGALRPSEIKTPNPPPSNKAKITAIATQPAMRGMSGERGDHRCPHARHEPRRRVASIDTPRLRATPERLAGTLRA